jgi:hypothetical protein
LNEIVRNRLRLPHAIVGKAVPPVQSARRPDCCPDFTLRT